MLKTFICGAGNFHQEEEEEEDPCCSSPSSSPMSSPSSTSPRTSPSTTPKRSSRTSCKAKNDTKKKKNKNPYAMRGLDKFAIVLADLDERRRKIYKQMGSENNDSLVRFGYSSSKGWVPIVVKLKDSKEDEIAKESSEALNSSTEDTLSNEEEKQSHRSNMDERTKKCLRANLERWRRHDYYLPLLILFILLCVMLYGRSFGIICTCIWWYLVPTRKDANSNSNGSRKKKHIRRVISEKNIEKKGITSPKRNFAP